MEVKGILHKFGTPIYVYEENKIIKNYNLIKNSIPYNKKIIHYAVMSNNRIEILKILKKIQAFVQVNSLYELELVKKSGFTSKEISFTSVGLDEETLRILIKENIQVNLDSIEEVEKYCRLNPNGKFAIRIKMDESIKIPKGSTNSPKNSDVGISIEDFEKVAKIAKKYDCKINGIHGYLASNILSSKPFIDSSDFIIKCARFFSNLEYINFGSGFGVPDKETDKEFNFEKIGNYYSKLTKELSEKLGREIELKVEPGRSLLASAGTLYAKVTNVKQVKEKKQIAVNAGFAEFARPRIYGAYHEIKVLEKEGEGNREQYDIRANSVLQSDFLGKDRTLPQVNEGDILVIKNVGAYGAVMASGFPGKPKPKEVLICANGEIKKV